MSLQTPHIDKIVIKCLSRSADGGSALYQHWVCLLAKKNNNNICTTSVQRLRHWSSIV